MAMRFMNGLTSIVSAANNPQLLKTQVESLSQHISMTQLFLSKLKCCVLSSIWLSCRTRCNRSHRIFKSECRSMLSSGALASNIWTWR